MGISQGKLLITSDDETALTFQSLYLPELSNIGRDTTRNITNLDDYGLEISQWGFPQGIDLPWLPADFPKLSAVTDQLDMKMYFGSISLPSLTTVPKIVNIHSHVREDIVLPALGVVGELSASGSMTAVFLPVLRSISKMVLWNGVEFSSCTQEIAAFNGYPEIHRMDPHPFRCKWKKDEEPLGVGAIIGICTGTAFVIGMLIIYFILWRRSQRRKAAKKRKEQEEYEMQQRYAVADCDSAVGTEVGSVHSDVTVVQQGTRGYVHRGAGDIPIVR
ncbi:hypothetical protein DL98DRAFT_515554 [Cadophora sp. DSE1049]|nr:hypothetical protein DL98DRAFT_515554 [Cadophora sp. DSE1049]